VRVETDEVVGIAGHDNRASRCGGGHDDGIIVRLASTFCILPTATTSIHVMKREIQAVIFDLDGTLPDRRRSFAAFVRDQHVRFSTFLAGVDQEQYVETLIRLDRDGYGPRRELFSGIVVQFGLGRDLADRLLTDYRSGFPQACMLFPDAVQTIAALRASGYRLGLITNGSARMQQRKLECLALQPAFDVILISEVEGVSKPDPEIFRRALERLHVDAHRAVFVGDHPHVDIAGARAAGMRTIWRRDPHVSRTAEADARIEEIRDLLPLLE
jgi:putative hydrolase of the HAD superfamily